jgi:phage terminase large subunit-like protein
MWTLVASSIPKWPGARLVVIGHAGDPSHWAHAILEHARASDTWHVSEVPGPLEWMSADALAEQRALLLPSEYARRHLNVWTAGEDKLTTVEDVRACIQHSGDLDYQTGCRYITSLDVGLVGDRTVALVAHAERRPAGVTVVVDRLNVWQGKRFRPVSLDVVEAWVEAACRDYHCALTFDPYQAQHLAQRLRDRHVRVEEYTFTQASTGRLAVTLYRLLRDHFLDLPDDDRLVDELVNVQLREVSPGSYRIDHASGRHDDMAIATAMAAAYLVENASAGTTGTIFSGLTVSLPAPVENGGNGSENPRTANRWRARSRR